MPQRVESSPISTAHVTPASSIVIPYLVRDPVNKSASHRDAHNQLDCLIQLDNDGASFVIPASSVIIPALSLSFPRRRESSPISTAHVTPASSIVIPYLVRDPVNKSASHRDAHNQLDCLIQLDNDGACFIIPAHVIPAQAGIQSNMYRPVIPAAGGDPVQQVPPRHPRAGGDPVQQVPPRHPRAGGDPVKQAPPRHPRAGGDPVQQVPPRHSRAGGNPVR